MGEMKQVEKVAGEKWNWWKIERSLMELHSKFLVMSEI